MQVKTQPFKEALELKGDGISFDVYGNGSKRLGDLCVTKAGLIWSKGQNARATRDGGINVKWEEFIDWVQSRRAAAGKTGGKLNAQAFASMKPQAMKAAGTGGQSGQGAKGMSGMRNAAASKLSGMGSSSSSSRGTTPKLSGTSASGSTRTVGAKAPMSPKAPMSSKTQISSKTPVSKSSMSAPVGGRAVTAKAPSEAGKLAAKRASTMKLAASTAKAAATKAAQAGKSAAQASKSAQTNKLPQSGKLSLKPRSGNAGPSKQAQAKAPKTLARKPAMQATGGSKMPSAARRKAN
jgi:hypothetical protein